jgi:hypothetical protein
VTFFEKIFLLQGNRTLNQQTRNTPFLYKRLNRNSEHKNLQLMKKQNQSNNWFSTTRSHSRCVKLKELPGKIILAFCLVFMVYQASAQEVKELSSALSDNNTEMVQLRSLVNDSQQTIYFQQGKIVGDIVESPVFADVDVASVKELYKINSEFNSVQIIRIRINNAEDLNLALDMTKLGTFKDLKYICFLCTFDICEGQSPKSYCETGKILKMINSGGSSSVHFYYLISIPS